LGGDSYLEALVEVNLAVISRVLLVPLGTLAFVPLLLTFRRSAGLLPVTESRMRNEPCPADPAGALDPSTFLFHRYLPLHAELDSNDGRFIVEMERK
jgi:hypothetical protein